MRLCLSLKLVVPALLFATASAPSACAANAVLSDSDLIARANDAFSVKEPPVDRVLGFHNGQMIIVDIRCSDVCPANTVRIIHYAGNAEAVCAQTRADLVTVVVPRSITVGPEKFCVPHALVSRRLYTDKPYQK